jgi:hypothetical protein
VPPPRIRNDRQCPALGCGGVSIRHVAHSWPAEEQRPPGVGGRPRTLSAAPAAAESLAGPTVSATCAPRRPSGPPFEASSGSPAVWCSISASSSAPSRTTTEDSPIQVMKPITAQSGLVCARSSLRPRRARLGCCASVLKHSKSAQADVCRSNLSSGEHGPPPFFTNSRNLVSSSARRRRERRHWKTESCSHTSRRAHHVRSATIGAGCAKTCPNCGSRTSPCGAR